MKKILLCALLGILSCQPPKRSQNSDKVIQQEADNRSKPNGLTEINGYPKLIDSLGLQEKYDETKWKLYLLRCNDTPKTATGKYILNPPLPFGYYNLQLDSLSIKSDTLAFYFDFYDDHGEPVNLIKYRDMKNPSSNGLMFYSLKSPYTNCFVSNHSSPWLDCVVINLLTHKDSLEFKAYYDTTSNKLVNPLQPEVIRFMQEHKREINPWLYKEAIKRGVLKE